MLATHPTRPITKHGYALNMFTKRVEIFAILRHVSWIWLRRNHMYSSLVIASKLQLRHEKDGLIDNSPEPTRLRGVRDFALTYASARRRHDSAASR